MTLVFSIIIYSLMNANIFHKNATKVPHESGIGQTPGLDLFDAIPCGSVGHPKLQVTSADS